MFAYYADLRDTLFFKLIHICKKIIIKKFFFIDFFLTHFREDKNRPSKKNFKLHFKARAHDNKMIYLPKFFIIALLYYSHLPRTYAKSGKGYIGKSFQKNYVDLQTIEILNVIIMFVHFTFI